MSSRWRLRCFSSILLLLGENLALVAEIPQDLISGTVDQSVLLPVSYKLNSTSHFPLPIRWTFNNPSNRVVSCTVHNCSLSPEGVPKNCSANHFPHPRYQGRVVFFPENASLLLRNLQLSDSGVYSITFRQQILTKNITLTVHSSHFSPEIPDHNDPQKESSRQISAYIIGVFSCLMFFFLLFLLICCIRHLGAVKQKKTRIIKQEVSNAEDSALESTVMRDVATLYATVGDSFEQSQWRAAPETVYASVTFNAPR